MNPIRNTIGYVLVPLQSGVNRVGYGLYEELENHRALKDALEENKRLNDEIGLLTEENNRLTQNEGELNRLRALYALDQDYLQYEKVAARVIAKDSENWFQVFRIDKGSQDGIRVDQNVMANGGLVGIVTDVGLNYATVRSIIDDESRVSATSLQSGSDCIVAGDLSLYESGRLRITDMQKDATIQDGDRIVTSNISSKFMPGILIGYAVDIQDDEKKLMKTGYLVPVADFDDLTEVLVLKDVKDDSFLDENDGQDVLMKSADTEAAAEESTEVAGTDAPSSESETTAADSSLAGETAESSAQWTGMEGLTPLSEITEQASTDDASSEDAG